MESPNRKMWGDRVSLGLLRPTRRAQSNLGLLCFRRWVCVTPSLSPAARGVGRNASHRRGRKNPQMGVFCPRQECVRAVAALSMVLAKNGAAGRVDGGFSILSQQNNMLFDGLLLFSPRNVVVPPNDSRLDVAVPPKDSWRRGQAFGGMTGRSVVVLPNDRRFVLSHLWQGCRIRGRIGITRRGANVAVLPVGRPVSAHSRGRQPDFLY